MGRSSALPDGFRLPATSRHGEAVVVAGAVFVPGAEDNGDIV